MLAEEQKIYELERQHVSGLLRPHCNFRLGAGEAADDKGWTPLHIATKRGDYVYTELHGVWRKPGYVSSRFPSRWVSSPLSLAISRNHHALVAVCQWVCGTRMRERLY